MQTRKTGSLHRFFRRTLRKSKPPLDNDEGQPASNASGATKEQVIITEVAGSQTLIKNIAPPSSDNETDKDGSLSAAFAYACQGLSDDQRTSLQSTKGLRQLYEQLNVSNEKSIEESPFRRGVQKLQPILEMLGGGLNLANPLAALDPIANNAFGILQSVMTIAIGICGAEAHFQAHIQEMFQKIPIIERYDSIWESCRVADSTVGFPILVRIYTNLLDFYFETMDTLMSGNFFFGLQKSRFRQRLPEIVSSFTNNLDQLDKILSVETHALIRKIDDDQASLKIRMLLSSDNQKKLADYYFSLKQRADEACGWIISTMAFQEWLQVSIDSPPIFSSRFCVLFGNMGSGKSVTTGFVVDFLNSNLALSGPLKPFVCVYYCKNDNETNKARSIYRSILFQVLVRMAQFTSIFMLWYKEQQMKNSLVDPTLDDDMLRSFLVNILQKFSRRVYLVLDGLDECDYDSRDHILHFFEELNGCAAPVHIFLSCRYDEYIKGRLPSGRKVLRMDTSPDRDRVIAAFHVNHLLSRQPENTKAFVIEELAPKAEGSAIWLKMVLEYLRRPHRNENEIRRLLQHVPSPQSLSKLYGKLFDTAISEHNDAIKIEYALETLAVSGRLLTVDELAYVVTLRMEHGNISSLTELEECVIDPNGLLELIGPFVSIMDTAGGATLRIVHQSLKDLIIKEAPANWGSHSDGTSVDYHERYLRLHSSLLQCCIDYLLLSDLRDKDLFPEQKLEEMEQQFQDLELLGAFAVYDDDATPDKPSSSHSSSYKKEITRDFDPELAGFGKLFTYAACFWTDHLKQCSPDVLPELCSVSQLACHGSLILRNWMETYKRPNLTSSPQINIDVEDYDDLVVAAHFGSHAFLIKYLEGKRQGDPVRAKSPVVAIKLAMQSGDLVTVKMLLQSDYLANQLRSATLLCEMMDIWAQSDSEKKNTKKTWRELLDMLVTRFFNGDLSSYSWANTILCAAARKGCLPVIEILFEKAAKEPKLAEALVEETQDDTIFQSIGEAANWSRVDVIQYLLKQDFVDITPHLHHHAISKKGSELPSNLNVLHCAVKSGNPDILRILVQHYPDGVNEQTEMGDTPLNLLLFAPPINVEAVRIMIEIGKADVNLSQGGEWFSPLRTAIRANNVEVCQLLASHGAHVDDAMTLDESGSPILKDRLEDAEMSQRILKVLVAASESEAYKMDSILGEH